MAANTTAALCAAWIALWPMPTAASAHGAALDGHLILNLWVAVGLLAAAHLLLLGGVAIRRAHDVQTEGRSHERVRLWRIEYIPVAVFAILLTVLGLRAERLWASARYTGPDLTAMQVEVTGVQFAWYFRYPGPDAAFGIKAIRWASTTPTRPAATTSSPPSWCSPQTARSTFGCARRM
jgi:cytochrome c oxidase subunit 2